MKPLSPRSPRRLEKEGRVANRNPTSGGGFSILEDQEGMEKLPGIPAGRT